MPKEYRKIEVVPYDPSWPLQYEIISKEIKEALGGNYIATYHVGSTSVEGLKAKPKIDVIAVVHNLEETIEKLERVGFEYRGEWNIPMHYGFRKKKPFKVNLHVYNEDNPEIELNVTFRNYLRKHPKISQEYAALKMALLKEKTSHEKNKSIFTGYSLGKSSFIARVLKEAGFDRLRFVICTHLDEWSAAKKFRQKYLFDKIPIKDPYEWTFNHKDHIHLILYKGVDIIGYAHLQLWPNNRVAIRIIVIEKAMRKKGFGAQFLSWIEAWFKLKRYKSIHAEVSPSALSFYKSQGYIETPFQDPDSYQTDKRDTPLGKVLS